MKEWIIIFIILIIIFGGALYIQNYLNKSSKNIISDLKELKAKIEEAQNTENREIIKKEVNKLYDEWSETEEKWAVIVFHSELDLIETSFIKMKSEIENGELSKSIEELETAIFLVNHIYETERFCLKNVF